MESAHHRSDGNVEDLGDLLVGETFHVGKHDGHAELLGNGLERLFHLGVGDALEHLGLRAAPGHGRFQASEPAVEVEVLHVLEVGLLGRRLVARYWLMNVLVRIR